MTNNVEAARILRQLVNQTTITPAARHVYKALAHAIAVLETPTPSRDDIANVIEDNTYVAATGPKVWVSGVGRAADAVLALLAHPGEPE